MARSDELGRGAQTELLFISNDYVDAFEKLNQFAVNIDQGIYSVEMFEDCSDTFVDMVSNLRKKLELFMEMCLPESKEEQSETVRNMPS